VNDIEIPVPVAATEAANSAAYSPPLDEADAGIGRDQVATHVGETIELPLSQWETEPAVLASADIPAPPSIEPPAPPLAATPPPPPAAPPPGDDEEAGATMTIIEHLEELRHRVTISAISVVVGAVIGWFIVPHVVQYLEDGARNLGGKFFSPTILGPFGLELKLSFLIGLIISSPMVLYQIWGFIAPGLTRRERRYALPFSLIGGALFAGGAVTGVLIVPLAIRFLIHFFSVLDLEQLLDIDKYIMFIALIAVIFGITFELPIFMVGFSLLGVVNSRFFIQKFRIAIFVIYGVSMVITPGADLISPLVLGTFLIVLYWLGVLLIRVIGR
jgi:sec-independent protein translocase protein TatC